MHELKRVTSLPDFPKNDAGLKRGTILKATHPAVIQLGLKVGAKIIIGFDGEYVRCGPLTWSVAQLAGEIALGVWSIEGTINLSDPERSITFARNIEEMEIVS